MTSAVDTADNVRKKVIWGGCPVAQWAVVGVEVCTASSLRGGTLSCGWGRRVHPSRGYASAGLQGV
jgi:hypothetical protein